MLDRALKLIVVLTLLFFLVECLIGLLCRTLSGLLLSFGAGAHLVASLFGGALTLGLLACLSAGLLVRARHFVATRDPRAARERAARQRAGRTRVRRPAEDAPVHEPEAPQPDPDPAINDEEH